ncbi:ribosome maturation factor RimP [Desulfovermiculus halophilus]|uniref:ribosome maturation factor RimP n=1 Tax=Desulfovermiculus halophilus TaxID=339722 RepID=UPI000488C0B8|nr:ribosome maturation factor RimP [Desulfovermiculus halophilus]
MNQHEHLVSLIEPIVRSLGLTLWGIEPPSSPKGGKLRVFLDSEQGVSVDQCAEASRHISMLLDVDDPIPGSYVLEVSSPGLERLFFHFHQLADYIGHPVAVTLKDPVQGRKKWKGTLLQAADNEITLNSKTQTVVLHWDQIHKMHLIYSGR